MPTLLLPYTNISFWNCSFKMAMNSTTGQNITVINPPSDCRRRVGMPAGRDGWSFSNGWFYVGGELGVDGGTGDKRDIS